MLGNIYLGKDMKVEGVLLDIQEKEEKGKSALELYIKGKESYILKETNFKPRFYVITSHNASSLKEKILKLDFTYKNEPFAPPKIDIEKRKFHGKDREVLKIMTENGRHINAIRDLIKEWDEVEETTGFEISTEQYYIIENQLKPMGWVEAEVDDKFVIKSIKEKKHEIDNLIIGAFDLEVYAKGEMPNAENEKNPIIMISYVNSKGTEKLFTWSEKLKTKGFIVKVKDEKEMIEEFVKQVNKDDVDIIMTYNGDMFDFPYLKKRAKYLKVKLPLGKDGSELFLRTGGMTSKGKITGRVHVDVYQVIQFLSRSGAVSLPEYKLERVYEALLGKSKIEFVGHKIWKEWEKNPEKLAKYCLQDSIACYELGREYETLGYELSRLTGTLLYTTTRVSTGTLVEHYIVKEAFNKGEIPPRRPKERDVRKRMFDPYEGAYVMEPKPGIHENLAEYDFRSLYPTIMIAHNIAPETLNVENCKDFDISPKGFKFCKDKQGFIPQLVEEVLRKRIKTKEKMKGMKKTDKNYQSLYGYQWGLKIVANSLMATEPIILKKNNKIEIKTIGAFVDENIKNPKKVGTTEIQKVEDYETLSFDEKETAFLPIKSVIRHNAPKKLYKVTLKSGRDITLTEDHGIFTFNKKGFRTIKTKNLKEGTPVVIPKGIPKIKPKYEKYINFLEILSTLPKKEIEGLYIRVSNKHFTKRTETRSRIKILNYLKNTGPDCIINISNNLKKDRHNIAKHLNQLEKSGYIKALKKPKKVPSQSQYFIITKAGINRLEVETVFSELFWYRNFAYFAKLTDLLKIIPYLQYDEIKNWQISTMGGAGASIPAAIKAVKSFYKFLGYYTAEGYSDKRKNPTGTSFRIQIAQDDVNIKIRKNIAKCIKESFGKTPRTDKKGCYLQQKSIFLIIKALGCGNNAREKRIPPCVFNARKECQIEFLHGYYLGDGNQTTPWPRMTSISKKLINDLSFLILLLGYNDLCIKKDSGVYRLEVRDGLPFMKRNRTREYTYVNTIPKEYILPLLTELKKVKTLKSDHRKTIPLNKARTIIKEYELKKGKNDYTRLISELLNGNIGLDKVKKIEIIKNHKEKYVYDLSVNETERFFAGTGFTGVHNSFYGYLGYPRSRWYSRPCAESITAWAREYIKKTIKDAEDFGFTPIYSDTDSVYVKIPKGWGEDKIYEFLEKVNKKLPDKMELEFENSHKRGIFISTRDKEKGAKKKYALIDKNNHIKIKGFELVRRDWSAIARDTQMKVLTYILKDGDEKKAISYVKEVIEKLKKKEVSNGELTIHTKITRPLENYSVLGPHTSAAIKANERGDKYGLGSMIDYIITSRGKSISEKADVAAYVKEGDYDIDYYINNQVVPAAMRILYALGYKEEDLLQKGKQKTIDSWFK